MRLEPFRAYGSRKQALVAIAAFTPLVSATAWTLVINSTYPIGIRLLFAAIIGTFALILVGPIHRLFTHGPMLEVDHNGFLWRGWSNTLIPWDAVGGWRTTRYIGTQYLTISLHHPEAYRATTAARWTQWPNRWLGHGDMSIATGGLNRTFEDFAAAFSRFAPKSPLPDDPRLARRLQRARDRSDRA